jgi:hypothetical protein
MVLATAEVVDTLEIGLQDGYSMVDHKMVTAWIECTTVVHTMVTAWTDYSTAKAFGVGRAV